jgi:amidase
LHDSITHGSSIRIPAAFNGLYGLRPSYHRIPYGGAVNSMEGQDSIPSVFGPLSSSSLGLKVFMKAVIDAKPWLKDPLVIRKPWDQQGYELAEHGNGNGLVFGIIWDDGRVVPHPPVRRALDMTRSALIAAGHKGLSRNMCICPYLYFVAHSCRLEAAPTSRSL